MNLKFQSIPALAPTELQNLSNTLPASSQRIPELDHIFEKIAQDQEKSLSALECLWCVLKKEEWDEVRSLNEANSTSKQLWIEAVNNKLLRYYLLRGYLRHFVENQPFATSLIDSFNTFKNNLSNHECIADLIDAVAEINLPNKIIYSVVTKCYQWNLGKHELLRILWENTGITTIDFDGFTIAVAEFFNVSNRESKNDIDKNKLGNWLVKCLSQELDINNKQAKIVEEILINVCKEDASQYPSFIDWLKFHYQKGDRAKYLSENARKNLREWIGAINFSDFAKLVDIIVFGEFINNKFVINRNKRLAKGSNNRKLKSRKDFWSNYSDRFQEIRILVPEKSIEKIDKEFHNNITVIKPNSNDFNTEICIFDFGYLTIVEFFRGKGTDSEMIIFRDNELIKNNLLSSKDISVSYIRNLGGEKQYHTGDWQKNFERILVQYGIYPNDNLVEFLISGNDKRRYDRQKGISASTQVKKRKS